MRSKRALNGNARLLSKRLRQSDIKFTVDELLAKLPLPANKKSKEGVWDLTPFEANGARLVFFAPNGTDYQTLHDEDEFYVIARGSGKIVIGEDTFEFTAGEACFVAANVPHCFEEFTDDFAPWAVFF